jgi:site-specific DNA-cytosine methylase
MKVLEIFCGTKSIGKAFKEKGHQVFSIDNDPQHSPDLCCDVLALNVNDLPWMPDVIWASPPCTTFSVASMGHHWGGGKGAYIPKTKEAIIGMRLMAKTKGIILKLKPKLWFIENPRGMMRKMIGLDEYMKTVTYCQYGDKRMKPTDLWTNANWTPRPMCKNGSHCHEAAPRGAKTGTQGLKGAKERGIIPVELCREIVKICEEQIK